MPHTTTLRDYTLDASLGKEFTQNAEDAGVVPVKLILDWNNPACSITLPRRQGLHSDEAGITGQNRRRQRPPGSQEAEASASKGPSKVQKHQNPGAEKLLRLCKESKPQRNKSNPTLSKGLPSLSISGRVCQKMLSWPTYTELKLRSLGSITSFTAMRFTNKPNMLASLSGQCCQGRALALRCSGWKQMGIGS